MPSFTSWHRLEPKSRAGDLREGVQAAVFDPLWLLAQQWRLGEYRGEDAASPVVIRLEGERSALTRFHPARPAPGTTGAAYDGAKTPLETLVEHERIPRAPERNLRLAAEAGLELQRRMAAKAVDPQVVAKYLADYAIDEPADPATVPAETVRFLSLVAGRVLDGNRLYGIFRPPGSTALVPPDPGYVQDSGERSKVTAAATEWIDWYDELFSEPDGATSSWVPERLEYEFSVAAPSADGEDVLVAPEYADGHLDWYSFDLATGAALGAAADASPATFQFEALPKRVSFGGMPARRWWQFEDAGVNFGKIDARAVDLAQMVLIEFATVYGSDHFEIPLQLDVGSLCRIRWLVVEDNFGGRTLIRPSAEAGVGSGKWRMFTLSVAGSEGTGDFLFLPPTLGPSLEGAVVEEVLLLRDEVANLAWGVEKVVEAPTGAPLDRHEAHQEQLRREERRQTPGAPPPKRAAPLAYRLQTEVPPHWIPLVPVQAGGRSIRLRVEQMLSNGQPVPPRSDLLTAKSPLDIFEEEVPRGGARVTRSYQYARWIDGSTHLWLGRRKRGGRGEGSSGLRFDVVEPSGGEAG